MADLAGNELGGITEAADGELGQPAEIVDQALHQVAGAADAELGELAEPDQQCVEGSTDIAGGRQCRRCGGCAHRGACCRERREPEESADDGLQQLADLTGCELGQVAHTADDRLHQPAEIVDQEAGEIPCGADTVLGKLPDPDEECIDGVTDVAGSGKGRRSDRCGCRRRDAVGGAGAAL